jgi:hypothetical protein
MILAGACENAFQRRGAKTQRNAKTFLCYLNSLRESKVSCNLKLEEAIRDFLTTAIIVNDQIS